MLRRPTRSPQTLRYAKRKPRRSGAFVVNRRTSLVAQTAGHTRVAEVAQEAVARARLVPEDVRLVMAKVVADYGVVPGLRRSVAERIGRDYDPARDWGGPGGDVAREVVGRNLHATRAQKRDADPRERHPAFLDTSWALSGVVLDRVGFHLEVTYRLARESFEEHASAVVADRVSGEGAVVGAADPDAPRAARDAVADDLGVVVGLFRPEDGDARITETDHIVGEDLGAGRIEDTRAAYGAVRDVVGEDLGAGGVADEQAKPVAYEIIPCDRGIEAFESLDRGVPFGDASDDIVHDLGVAGTVPDKDATVFVGFRDMVLRDSGVDTLGKGDPASDLACDTVSLNSSVASEVTFEYERAIEAPDREARNANIAHALALPGELAGFDVHVAEEANSPRSESLRAGRVCLGSGGHFDHGVVFSAQLYPVLADHYILSVNSTDHDSVARMGGVYGLLDGLGRPNHRALRSGGADRRRQSHPACHQHRQSHGGQQHYGAPHKETAFLQGAW